MIKSIHHQQAGHIHVDRITVTGPLNHKPVGALFYKAFDEDSVVPVGASAFKPRRKRNSDEVYVHSREVQSNGRAYMLEIDCCPPKILQKHNFFGHSDVLDYTYAMFDHQTRKHGLNVTEDEREEWRTGQVGLTEIHLTGNFWCPPSAKLPIIDAIDQNNRSGKHRDIKTSLTLGFTGVRRSKYHTTTIYDKEVLLAGEWKKCGTYQGKIVQLANGSIRVEVKLFSQGLERRGLGYVMRWADVDVDALFFEILAKYNIRNAIQPLLTEDEQSMLSKPERRAYLLWLKGESLSDHFSRTTVWKYGKDIYEKTGIDIRGDRRPEALPIVDLTEILTRENIVPLPDWAIGSPYYWPPGAAFANDSKPK